MQWPSSNSVCFRAPYLYPVNRSQNFCFSQMREKNWFVQRKIKKHRLQRRRWETKIPLRELLASQGSTSVEDPVLPLNRTLWRCHDSDGDNSLKLSPGATGTHSTCTHSVRLHNLHQFLTPLVSYSLVSQ